jgi:hypothetical protein
MQVLDEPAASLRRGAAEHGDHPHAIRVGDRPVAEPIAHRALGPGGVPPADIRRGGALGLVLDRAQERIGRPPTTALHVFQLLPTRRVVVARG